MTVDYHSTVKLSNIKHYHNDVYKRWIRSGTEINKILTIFITSPGLELVANAYKITGEITFLKEGLWAQQNYQET